MVIIETTSLSRRFGEVLAVDAVTMSVEAGEAFGLLGRNGAGKSTVIKILTTLLPPTSGTAAVAGYDVVRQPEEVRQNIGYVPQMISADGTLTGYENVLVFAKLYGVPRLEREARVRDALAFMGLQEAASKLVRDYSGGMIRLLEIAQATLHRPRVLFLDEPTIGLDPLSRQTVWEHLEQLRFEYGTTMFLTTHDMEEADALCDRLSIMHQGKLVVTGTPEELKAVIGPGVSLSDVFIHYTGAGLGETGGGYREAARTRYTARRLG